MTISLNGMDAVSTRLFLPWTGAWIADVDFNLTLPTVPKGPAVLKIGEALAMGTIDPEASGKFGEKARARVVAGGGGWHRPVSARQFHNDAGVFDAAVISATAAEIGEKAVVATPSRLGVDYLRSTGPASRVLAGRDWYVDLLGVTIVGPRVPIPATPEIQILSWDPKEQRAELASDSIIAPGTILVSPLFGTATVRDVEQTFVDSGARATAWCGEAKASRLSSLFASLVREYGGTAHSRPHRYRVVAEGVDGRITLQAVDRAAGVPDSIALPPWFGLPGCTAKAMPGMEAAVVFLGGDPAQPIVVSFHGGDDTASGVATQASMAALFGAMVTFAGAMQAFCNAPAVAALSTATAQAAAGAAAALIPFLQAPATFSQRTKAS